MTTLQCLEKKEKEPCSNKHETPPYPPPPPPPKKNMLLLRKTVHLHVNSIKLGAKRVIYQNLCNFFRKANHIFDKVFLSAIKRSYFGLSENFIVVR